MTKIHGNNSGNTLFGTTTTTNLGLAATTY